MILGVLDDLLERPAKQQIALLAGILIAVAGIDWQYWYGPRQQELAALRQQVAERQAELSLRKGKTDARADAEREIRELNVELKRASARLPDQREIADLLSSVASSARASGLEIVLFRQRPEVLHDFHAEVPVEMQIRGTYHDVALFLDRVKRLDRIVNITDIKLTKPRVEGDRVTLEGACTATTFRFLDEGERQRALEEKKKGGANAPRGGHNRKGAGKSA